MTACANAEWHDVFTCSDTVRLGMPHLDIFGLSDLYCLAEAGNKHWSLISKFTETPPSRWNGEDGQRVYANFVYASISHDRRHQVQEDDMVRIECTPHGLCPPYLVSETHFIAPSSHVAATVSLMSALTSKKGDSNNTFHRSALNFRVASFGEVAIDLARRRFKEMAAHDDHELTVRHEHRVNPAVDFNAANFMYFVNYCQIFKRYESPELSANAPVRRREIAYFGNVDPFERLTISAREEGMTVASSMVRSSDRKCIARSLSTCAVWPRESANPELQRSRELQADTMDRQEQAKPTPALVK